MVADRDIVILEDEVSAEDVSVDSRFFHNAGAGFPRPDLCPSAESTSQAYLGGVAVVDSARAPLIRATELVNRPNRDPLSEKPFRRTRARPRISVQLSVTKGSVEYFNSVLDFQILSRGWQARVLRRVASAVAPARSSASARLTHIPRLPQPLGPGPFRCLKLRCLRMRWVPFDAFDPSHARFAGACTGHEKGTCSVASPECSASSW
jgi:hypothetical protein